MIFYIYIPGKPKPIEVSVEVLPRIGETVVIQLPGFNSPHKYEIKHIEHDVEFAPPAVFLYVED